MKNKILFLFLLSGPTLFAQDKMLTTENCVFASRDGLTPQRFAQLNWIKGTDEYYFIDKTSGTETLVRAKATEKGPAKKIIDLNKLNNLLKQTAITGAGDEKTFPTITWKNSGSFSFEAANTIFTYDTNSKKITSQAKPQFTQTAENF
ncbi:MAG TPA: hypothetical protein VFJ43_09390, partial [Bacteroidia bacterium]|nr:hypothetical protein [Bacteroidia bacterium]